MARITKRQDTSKKEGDIRFGAAFLFYLMVHNHLPDIWIYLPDILNWHKNGK